MKKTFDFGKIAYPNPKRRANRVTVTVELEKRGGETTYTIDRATGVKTVTGKTPEYLEFSASALVWNQCNTDCVAGGQCLDTIAKHARQLRNRDLFMEIYDLWKTYHLNGMNAGTPEQEAAIKAWKEAGNHYDYDAACDYLKSIGLYEVNYTGLTIGRRFDNEPYKYGHGWIVNELPAEAVKRIEAVLNYVD